MKTSKNIKAKTGYYRVKVVGIFNSRNEAETKIKEIKNARTRNFCASQNFIRPGDLL
jgi:cell division protein FtsN